MKIFVVSFFAKVKQVKTLTLVVLSEKKNANNSSGSKKKKDAADIRNSVLIYQSKANLDTKILFCKITHPLNPEIRKCC